MPDNNSRLDAEVELDLSWSKDCVISEISRTLEVSTNLVSCPLVLAMKAAFTTEATFKLIMLNFMSM